jgi:dTDP-4-amino-4,6-dideoxygalactose transaminase
MVVTANAQVADDIRALRNVGQRVKNRHELMPFNHRIDTLQAALLRVKLTHLETWNESRRQCAALYDTLLAGSDIIAPIETPESTHVYHLYVIRSSQRDALQAYLKEQGIGTAIQYPLPVHLQPFYANRGFQQGQFPVAEQVCGEILSLPMFPEMTAEQVEYVVAQVLEFAKTASAVGSL